MKTAIVYKITNIMNNSIYVGSSAFYKRRKREHIYDLRKNKHSCRHLQAAYNLYGEDKFEFSILEEFPFNTKEDITNKEQYYIDTLSPEYNLCPIANSCLGIKRSDEFKKIVSNRVGVKRREVMKLFDQKYSNSEIAKMVSLHITAVLEAKRIYCKEKGIIPRRNGIQVLNTETGEIYDSMEEAAIKINHTSKMLRRKLRGKSKNNTKLVIYERTENSTS